MNKTVCFIILGWTTDIFYGWGHFFGLAVAGMLMLAMEWWSFEIGTVLAGLLGPVPLAAQAIAFQIISFAYMVSYSSLLILILTYTALKSTSVTFPA
jgi:Na+-driven multidrug efflux pump